MKLSFQFVIALSLFLAACSGPRPETRASAPPAPIAVTTLTVTTEEWPGVYEATGTVHAGTSASIAARIQASVREVLVHESDRVRAGQTLAILDAREPEVAVRRSVAMLEEVRAALPEAEAGVAAADAHVQLAQATFRRIEELFAKRSVSNQEFDEASSRLHAAEAGRDMARAHRVQLESQAARVAQDGEAARIALSWATITSPFDGIVTARTAEPGTMALPGVPLFTLEQAGGYRLEAAVEESRVRQIRNGQPVTVTLDGIPQPIAGRVGEIASAIDPASRSNIVKIDLPALPQLRSGLFGRAAFTQGPRRLVAIPAASVHQQGQLSSVFVAENGRARNRLITVGQAQAGRLEVLSGLTEGEFLIYPVPPSLTDGATVEVRR